MKKLWWFWDSGLKGALTFTALFIGFGLLWAPYVEAQLSNETVCFPPDVIDTAAKNQGMMFREAGELTEPGPGRVIALYRNSDGSKWSLWSYDANEGCFFARGTGWSYYDGDNQPEEMKP